MPNTTNKPRILLVAPYGIALRDLLLIKELSGFLTETFDIDVLTEVNFADTSEWGISRVVNQSQSGILTKLGRSLNHRSIAVRRWMDFKPYHVQQELMPLYDVLVGVDEIQSVATPNYELWARIGSSFIGSFLRRATSFFPRFGPVYKSLKRGDYVAVLATHPTEGESNVIGSMANRCEVPLICWSMGVDNLQGGPLVMRPDMFLLWGPEQEQYLQNHYKIFQPQLNDSTHSVIGALCHDTLAESNPDAFSEAYPHISPNDVVVMFAAYTETGYPGQPDTCREILNFFDKNDIDGHLVVRTRSDLDHVVWEKFQREEPDRVTLQSTKGVFFTKWSLNRTVSRAIELEEVELYGATLKRATMIASAAFSTVAFDAMALGTPALSLGLSTSPESRRFMADFYARGGSIIPALRYMDFITNEAHFESELMRILCGPQTNIPSEPNYRAYLEQVKPTSGASGSIAANAISEFLSNYGVHMDRTKAEV